MSRAFLTPLTSPSMPLLSSIPAPAWMLPVPSLKPWRSLFPIASFFRLLMRFSFHGWSPRFGLLLSLGLLPGGCCDDAGRCFRGARRSWSALDSVLPDVTMRAIRLCFFFVFGVLLGGASVFAFANVQLPGGGPGPTINFNYPGGINGPRRAGGPIYDFPGAPNGWGRMRDINKLSIGGRTWDFIGGRNFAPRAIAAAGVGLAKKLGPIGIGLTLADLIWDDELGRWLFPAEFDGVTDRTGEDIKIQCDDNSPGVVVNWRNGWQTTGYFPSVTYGGTVPPGFSHANNCDVRLFPWYGPESQARFGGVARRQVQPCVPPQQLNADGQCAIPEPRSATDQEIEDAIYVELVARGMGSDLARRLIERGYEIPVDSVDASGPTSIPGGTSTTTTNGPAGTTTTTTNNTYDITYDTNTTNNTTTVTITNNSTTTTTAPDGTTTTTTTTESPPSGSTAPETPPEEQKQLCDEFPDASACQKLDVPVEEPPQQEEVTVTFNPSGGFGGSGSCPAPYSFSVQGRSFSIDYQPFCNFFVAVRPVVVAIAFITAMLIALGGYKRD